MRNVVKRAAAYEEHVCCRPGVTGTDMSRTRGWIWCSERCALYVLLTRHAVLCTLPLYSRVVE